MAQGSFYHQKKLLWRQNILTWNAVILLAKQGYGWVCRLAKWCLSQFLDEIRTKSIATPSGWDVVYWNYPKTLNQVSQTVCPYPFTLLHQRGTVRIRCLAMNIRKWSGQVLTQESSKPTVRPPHLPSLAKSAPTISNVNTLLIVKEKVYILHKNLQLSTFLKMISNGKSWRERKKNQKKKTGLLQRTMNAYLRNSALTKPQYRPAE